MTSRTIRGLVPNLSEDNRHISSSAPFSFHSLPLGDSSCGHGQGQCPGACVCGYFGCLSLCFPQGSTHREDRGRLGRPGPEASSIRAGSDPGGRLRPRGAHSHPGQIQGSAAVLGGPEEVQVAVMLDGGGLWGPRSLAPSSRVYQPLSTS